MEERKGEEEGGRGRGEEGEGGKSPGGAARPGASGKRVLPRGGGSSEQAGSPAAPAQGPHRPRRPPSAQAGLPLSAPRPQPRPGQEAGLPEPPNGVGSRVGISCGPLLSSQAPIAHVGREEEQAAPSTKVILGHLRRRGPWTCRGHFPAPGSP